VLGVPRAKCSAYMLLSPHSSDQAAPSTCLPPCCCCFGPSDVSRYPAPSGVDTNPLKISTPWCVRPLSAYISSTTTALSRVLKSVMRKILQPARRRLRARRRHLSELIDSISTSTPPSTPMKELLSGEARPWCRPGVSELLTPYLPMRRRFLSINWTLGRDVDASLR